MLGIEVLVSYPCVVAVLGEDFTEPSPLQLIFSSGDMMDNTSCATFGIVNDGNLEFDHEFNITLGDVTATGTVAPCTTINPSTTVTINDDEGIHCVVLCCIETAVKSIESVSCKQCSTLSPPPPPPPPPKPQNKKC